MVTLLGAAAYVFGAPAVLAGGFATGAVLAGGAVVGAFFTAYSNPDTAFCGDFCKKQSENPLVPSMLDTSTRVTECYPEPGRPFFIVI